MTAAQAEELRRQIRVFFSLLARKDRDGLSHFLHERVIFVPRIVEGERYEGREKVLTVFYDDVFSWPIYEPQVRRIEPLSEAFAIVRGRVRYMKSSGGLADDPVVWLLGMTGGQLTHLYGASSRHEALSHLGS